MTTRNLAVAIAVLSAILFIAPLRTGDLTGYDDASFSHISQEIVRSGDWLTLHSNGYPAFEHPPLFEWIQAAVFSVFGISDMAARMPSALFGLGIVLLVYFLASKIFNDSLSAVLAMLVMAGSIYFVKYAARAMTDVPFTFFFLCAICAWWLARDDPRWYPAAGLAVGAALMTRGFMGFGLPVIFVIEAVLTRRRPPLGYGIAAAVIAFAPLAAWYVHLFSYGDEFLQVHSQWLDRQVYGALTPAWRRFTGAPEYAWMLVKSYWPWLPFLIAGLVTAIRSRDRRWILPIVWLAVVFAICSVTKSRVLRYMLPAYPAMAILSAFGLRTLISENRLKTGLRFLIPVLGIGVMGVAAFPPVRWHALETRPLAIAVTAATTPGERIGFYDEGQPRYDETNQLLWYGERYFVFLFDHDSLLKQLDNPATRVYIMDRATFDADIVRTRRHEIIASRGHLVCFRLLR
ncbi:MAG: glycosyltransferase family 39 protein [Bryobacteraceae bacterium]|nr:glycosyltransferase family 39 protein [Bryobacteraceae bacterium]